MITILWTAYLAVMIFLIPTIINNIITYHLNNYGWEDDIIFECQSKRDKRILIIECWLLSIMVAIWYMCFLH